MVNGGGVTWRRRRTGGEDVADKISNVGGAVEEVMVGTHTRTGTVDI